MLNCEWRFNAVKILVTNDDGILSTGMWTLAQGLKKIAPVVIVAPDREQSAVGTAVTLHQLLRARKVKPSVPEIETYTVDGMPADSVILGLEKLFRGEIGLVVSGINQGMNLGDDVLISGTVGSALQGYLRGLPAFAVSTDAFDNAHIEKTARLASLLAEKVMNKTLPSDIFLNINLPKSQSATVKGIKITRLASSTHIDTVEEGHDWKGAHYRLVRQRIDKDTVEMDKESDVWAVMQGYASITPLNTYMASNPPPVFHDGLCSQLFEELKKC